MPNIRFAILAVAIISSASFCNITVADDGVAISVFDDSESNFLNLTVPTAVTAPAWLDDAVNSDAKTKEEGKEAKAKDEEADEEPTAEERIKELEEKLKKLDSSWSKFDDAEKKKKADAAKKPTFKIGGRVHMDYWDFLEQSQGISNFEHPTPGPGFGNDPDDTFAFRRIRLEIQGDVPDNMLYRMQVDFNNPSTPEIKDVYMGFKELPGNQTLLIGNQKRPLGLDHLNSSRYNVFVERPLVIETFNSDARRPGICMYGQSDDESLIWAYGAYYLEAIPTDGRYVGDARQMSINGRLAGSPWYDESTNGA